MPAIGRKPLGRAGSSTILQPQSGQAPGAAVGASLTKTTPVARALIASRQAFFTAKDLQKPERLHQVIYQQGQATQTALHALSSNPMAAGVLLPGLVFTAGQTQYISHGLGRAYSGWEIARTQVTSPSAAPYGSLYNQSADGVLVSSSPLYVQIPQSHAGASAGTTLTMGASGNIAINQPGTYAINAACTVKGSATNIDYVLSMFINGSVTADMSIRVTTNPTILGWQPVQLCGVRSLNAGDTVDLRALLNTGTTLAVDSSNLSVGALSAPIMTEATLPSGVSPSQQIGLTASLPGTYSVWVY